MDKKREIRAEAALPNVVVAPEQSDRNESVTANHSGTIRCRNLRLAPGSKNRLVPVEDFGKLTQGQTGSRPLGKITHPDFGECLVLVWNTIVRIVYGIGQNGEDTVTRSLEPMHGEYVSWYKESESTLVINTTLTSYTLTAVEGADFSFVDNEIDVPEVVMSVKESSTFSRTIDRFVLDHSLDLTNPVLNEKDRNHLLLDILRAYNGMAFSARQSGFNLQPLMVRYKYYDRRGRVVYVSPIRLFMHRTGSQLVDEMSFHYDANTRSAFDISAEGYRIDVTAPAPDTELNQRIGKLVFEGAPFSTPFIMNHNLMETSADTSRNVMRFFMPGASQGMRTDEERIDRVNRQIYIHFDELCHELHTVRDPFSTNRAFESYIHWHGRECGYSISDDTRYLNRELERFSKRKENQTEQQSEAMRRLLNAPNRFVAETTSVNGDTVLHGNIHRLPAPAPPVTELAIEHDTASAFAAFSAIEYIDGTVDVTITEGSSNAPTALTPIVSFPSESVVRIYGMTRTSKGIAPFEYRMRPSGIPGLSVSVDLSCKPLSLSYQSGLIFSIPQSTHKGEHYPALLVSARSNDPMNVVSVSSSHQGALRAITRATATSSAWDWSRNRFYTFGESGIYLAVANSKSELSAIQKLDGRSVSDRRKVAIGRGDSGVTAIAGRDAVNVRGSKVTDLPGITPKDIRSLAFDNGDLWMVCEKGMNIVRPHEAPNHYYERDLPEVDELCGEDEGRMFIVTKEGDVLDSSKRVLSEKEIEWSCRLSVNETVKPPVRGTLAKVVKITAVGLLMVASAIKAKFTATSDYGATSATLVRLLFSVLMDGCLKEPLYLPLKCQDRSYLTFTLKGIVSPDMRLSGMRLVTSN